MDYRLEFWKVYKRLRQLEKRVADLEDALNEKGPEAEASELSQLRLPGID